MVSSLRLRPAFVAVGFAVAVTVSGSEAFLAARTPSGYRLAHSTFLGGSEWEQAREVVVHPDGAVQPRRGGKGDAFVVKLVPGPEPRP